MADQQSPDNESTAETQAVGTQPEPGDGPASRGVRSRLKERRTVILAIAIALIAILIAGSITMCRRTPPVQTAPIEPAAAEVFLEPREATGENPFAPTSFATVQPAPTNPGTDPLGPPSPAAPPPPDGQAAAMAVRTANGDLPGLYGGTLDVTTCDAELMINYLGQNPDKARAWAGVHRVTPEQIAAYVRELTPVLLRTDTRITDHGYIDVGQAVPRQAVLEAGTAVLVDKYGSPRVRCFSGNPLLDPVAVAAAAPARRAAPAPGAPPVVQQGAAPAPRIVFVGPRWPRFDPLTLVVIRRVIRIIDIFVLWDFRRGTVFGRQIGILIRDIANLLDPRLRRLIPPNLLLPPPPRRLPVQAAPPQRPPVQAPLPQQGLPARVPPVQQAPVPAPQQPAPVPAPPPLVDVFEPEPPIYDPGPAFAPDPYYPPPVHDQGPMLAPPPVDAPIHEPPPEAPAWEESPPNGCLPDSSTGYCEPAPHG